MLMLMLENDASAQRVNPGDAHIFVVDDLPDFQEFMRDVLTDEGYKVSTFFTASEAAEAAPNVRPDMVISDVRLGEESGFDLLQALVRDPSTRNIPLLLCTAATMDVEEQSHSLGWQHVRVLYKPFDISELLTQVREMLDESRASS